jgi:nanoRNase/pAp phosphatase (c-di-AMP/oligoRNAs hydrolase)
MNRIITHQYVDVDAVSSVWATRKFVPGYSTAPVVFVPGNWNGEDAQE